MQAERLLPGCEAYVSLPDTYGYCVYKMAETFVTAEDALRYCSDAGHWASRCRHAWVAQHTRPALGFTTQALLQVCGEDADCAFELIDFRPAQDVVEQMDLCARYAGAYQDDCTGHAMQRWWLSHPDLDAFNRVARAPTHAPDKVGYFLGASVACAGVGVCTVATPRAAQVCAATQVHLTRRPDLCPRYVPVRLRPDGAPPR